MTCYSYTSGDPILYNNNVEVVFTASGVNYSFSSISWICEFPVTSQLAVFTRPTPSGTETLQVQGTDYTVNTTLNQIVFTTVPTGQVVIRRTTPSEKMLFKFVDGAKITAKQLNASLHQLLFMVQEKEFSGATFNHVYSISASIPAWTTATVYTTGQVVSSGGAFFVCIANHTSTAAPPNVNWTIINPTTSGFVIQGGPNPVVFNLNTLVPGSALVWNGSQFIANTFQGTIGALSDVLITSPANKNILVFNSSNSKWENKAPTVDITLSNLLFSDRTFYNNGGFNSFNTAGTISVSGKSELDGFKNASNKWVLTDAPTVYHIIKKLIPLEQDPETYFDNITTSLTGLAANIANPVKVKFQWDLGLERRDKVDFTTGQVLSDLPTMFWDDPDELYSITGYSTASSLKRHGIQETSVSGNIHRCSPYYYQEITSAAAPVSYISKLKGYGIKSFYLSVPESHTSALADLPAMSGTNTYFSSPGTINSNALVDDLNTIGNENATTHRDYYLMGLRDLAFAAARANPGATSTVKQRDNLSRFLKGHLIASVYNGLSNVSFRRLEDVSETATNCLWKIPKQIIYYNKAALALANKDFSDLFTNSSFNTETVRFQGYSELRGANTNVNSSVLADGQGVYFKADAYWNNWCNRWSTDPTADLSTQRFNEADIDWVVKGITTSATNVELFRLYGNLPEFTFTTTAPTASSPGNLYFPWSFRPNDIRNGTAPLDTVGLIGTHLLNIDANTLFSSASNFIPDPVDEYVFRIVTKKSLLPFFKSDSFSHLKSSIILEYGFTDHNFNNKTTELTDKNTIFKQGLLRSGPSRANSRLDKSKVRVYVKNETVEVIGTDKRYVITLAIVVPRLKSIGYSKVFRKFIPTVNTSDYPIAASSTVDSEIDSGPWNFSDIDIEDINATYSQTGTTWIGASKYVAPTLAQNLIASTETFTTTNILGNPADSFRSDAQFVSGRNECAVKFTRIGIPSNLWIRLSVLNTDGSTDIITSGGFDTSTDE